MFKGNASFWIRLLLGVGLALMLAALYLIFIYVPAEQTMGDIQRIFYFHVPLAWVAFLAFLVVFVCSILFLWTRVIKWDIIARSSAVVGVIFTTLVLITGPIWAKAAWGVWWTWDVRLTATLILWFIYLAYFLIRRYTADEAKGARLAAVLGIVGFVDVPIVALAIQLWRTQHPGPVVFEGGLAPSMLLTLLVSIAAFTVLYIILVTCATTVENLDTDVRKLKNIKER